MSPDEKPLKDHAADYVRQIRGTVDDDWAIILLREFGEKSYRQGWKTAMEQIAKIADGMKK